MIFKNEEENSFSIKLEVSNKMSNFTHKSFSIIKRITRSKCLDSNFLIASQLNHVLNYLLSLRSFITIYFSFIEKKRNENIFCFHCEYVLSKWKIRESVNNEMNFRNFAEFISYTQQ